MTDIRSSTSRPHVFIQRRTEPGWHFLTKDGRYVHDPEGQQRAPLHASVSRQRSRVPGLLQGQSRRSLQGGCQCLCLVPDRYRGAAIVWFTPMPSSPAGIRCRWSRGRVPPRVQPVRDPQYAASNQAVCVVANVYQGMEGVEPGEVKWLRINEALPRYWSTGRRWDPSLSSSSWKAALWPRVQWGVVPVEKDGSAHFRRAGQSQHLLPGPGRELPGTPARADVRELRARRGPFLHGLSRAIQPHRVSGRLRDAAGA